MDSKKVLEEKVEIQEGIEISLEGSVIKVKGTNGELSRDLFSPIINIEKKENKIILSSSITTRKSFKILRTFAAHIKNMMRGAKENFKYELKICSGHFPANIKKENDIIIISNFLGEKIPRKSKILADVQVDIKGDLIIVQSPNIEKAGQTAANLEQATKIKKRDRRVFQDGCYIISKP